jgi:antibiotic biosynthesis monooxygenase (ABM) superfamily enzyme
MFVTILTYRARAGQENNIAILHEEWQRDRRPSAVGYLSGELLRDIKNPQIFIEIARFDSEASSRSLADDPEQDAWYRRLASLTEAEPVFTDCRVAWQSEEAHQREVRIVSGL